MSNEDQPAKKGLPVLSEKQKLKAKQDLINNTLENAINSELQQVGAAFG